MMSTPPKHMILSMVIYLQELKTIIFEKSGISRDFFFKFEDVATKMQGFENGKIGKFDCIDFAIT